MKLNNLIQRIQSLYSKGVQSDDSRLSPRHIYSVFLTIRAKLLVQKVNKRQFINQWNYQTLNCVELIEAEPYECPCLPSIGCKILRTKHKLPKPLDGYYNGHIIQSVTSVDGSISYSETTWESKKYKKGNKYTAKKFDYYFRDDYLYVESKDSTKILSITGLFDDPLEAQKYPSLCDENCEECFDCESMLEKDFPIDKDMAEDLIKMSRDELLIIFSQGREDISNNTRDNLQQESK